MSNKRSYLEMLNAGRQRRPSAALDGLNRSLETLERRLRQAALPDDRDAAPVPGRAEDEVGGRQPAAPDAERVRNHADGAVLAGELRTLREEFASRDHRREQQAEDLAEGLHGGFESLRRELERGQGADRQRLDAELINEFDRLSAAINGLSDKADERGVGSLRRELEQVKGSMDALAREDSLRSVATRWDALETRLEGFEAKLDAPRADGCGEARLADLDRRLDAIGTALAALPTTRNVQSSVATFEERMGELAQVVAAAAREPAPLPREPFERIEARLSAVSQRMESLRDGAASDAVVERLVQLSARVDELAAKANLPAKAVEQLARQVAIIAEKLDRVGGASDPDFVFKAIEQRFDTLAAMLERRHGDSGARAETLFRDLERRLDEVVERLDAQPARDAAEQSRAVAAVLDARFEDFARRFGGPASDAKATEARAAEAKVARGLEEQIKVLTEHLARPGPDAAALDVLVPRMERLERSLSEGIAMQGERVVAAAREAAESAVRALATAGRGEGEAVAGLAQDLKTLESLNRRSDERNARTFEAIHDTLIKIVDRLTTLEPEPERDAGRDAGRDPVRKPARATVVDAPSLDLDRPAPLGRLGPEAAGPASPPAASPPAASPPAASPPAASLAVTADIAEGPAAQAPRRRSMLGGLSRALGRGRNAPDAVAPAAPAVPETPAFDLDAAIDPKIANRPLEPGSGAPDLSAIMRRVRDERAQAAQTSGAGGAADAAKSDFIAAARRAAQAAAAEAEIVKSGAAGATPAGKRRIGSLLRRRTVLLAVAAIMMALAGFQAAGPYLADPDPQITAGLPDSEAPASDASLLAAAPQEPDETSSLPAVPPAARLSATAEAASSGAPAPAAVRPAEAAPAAEATTPLAAPAAATPLPAPAAATPLPASAAATPLPASAAATLAVPAAVEPAALREAAEAGDAKALWEVATRFAVGRGVPSDQAAAARWFEAAAELGLAPAQYRIGSLYEKGAGVARDAGKAKSWYLKAAEAGNSGAMHNLAVLYAMGADGATDNETAVRWFTAAAERGVKDSQFNLGILAAKGVGMGQDLESSYKWFALVAGTGDEDAAAKRDEVAKALKPDRLKRAMATTELWKAKATDPEANTVEIPESWQDEAAPDSTASVDMKAAVRTIQLILEKNGYEPGGTDGVMGGRTKSAIIAFQKDNDLPANGEVDDKLVKALLARK